MVGVLVGLGTALALALLLLFVLLTGTIECGRVLSFTLLRALAFALPLAAALRLGAALSPLPARLTGALVRGRGAGGFVRPAEVGFGLGVGLPPPCGASIIAAEPPTVTSSATKIVTMPITVVLNPENFSFITHLSLIPHHHLAGHRPLARGSSDTIRIATSVLR